MMNPHNDTIRRALNLAIGAVFELSDNGCTVTNVRIQGGKPHIDVDRRPPGVGTVVRSAASLFSPTAHCFGELKGCRVDWDEAQSIAQAEGLHS